MLDSFRHDKITTFILYILICSNSVVLHHAVNQREGNERGRRSWVVAKGGRGGWNGGGNTISSILYPEGSRYLEAEGRGGLGRGEQVHGNSEIIAYACEADI